MVRSVIEHSGYRETGTYDRRPVTGAGKSEIVEELASAASAFVEQNLPTISPISLIPSLGDRRRFGGKKSD